MTRIGGREETELVQSPVKHIPPCVACFSSFLVSAALHCNVPNNLPFTSVPCPPGERRESEGSLGKVRTTQTPQPRPRIPSGPSLHLIAPSTLNRHSPFAPQHSGGIPAEIYDNLSTRICTRLLDRMKTLCVRVRTRVRALVRHASI